MGTAASTDVTHVNAKVHIIELAPVIPDTELFRFRNGVPLTSGARIIALMDDPSGFYAWDFLDFSQGP